MLSRLRHSVLGAWLASAYALAVLAAALAPAPAFAHPALEGAVLCSGQPAPDQNAPVAAGGEQHCQGCPANPFVAAPSGPVEPMAARIAVRLGVLQPGASGPPPGIAPGLPQSRGPPARVIA